MPQPAIVANKSDKYLTFRLVREKYGVEILKIREIIGMVDITSVPQTPDFVKGVINLRGKVIPVVDLRVKFGLEATEYTRETCMIIVDMKGKHIGLIVDAVHDVIELKQEQIDEASFGIKIESDFLSGIGKFGNEVIILLNIDRVLSSDEFVKTIGM